MTMQADGYRVPPTALVTVAQDLTGAWADCGAEIQTDGYRYLGLYVNLDINLSNDARIRVLAKRASTGDDEYVLPIKTVGASDIKVEDSYYEFNDDADQKVFIPIELTNLIPFVQVQVMAGTVGGTAGQIDSLYYTLGK